MNPQAYNRYSYVVNSPINLNDPTGHAYCDFINSQNKDDCEGGLANSQSSSVIWDNNDDEEEEDEIIEDLLSDFDYQSTCEMFVTGAPLLCNTENFTSTYNYFSSSTQDLFSSPHPLSYFSMFFDISNSRGWTPVRIPVLGFALDYTAQLTNDVGPNGTPTFEHHLRALVVAGEGQVISGVSALASGLSALGSTPTGPGVIIVAVSAYVASSIALSSLADTINNEVFFPAIHDITH